MATDTDIERDRYIDGSMATDGDVRTASKGEPEAKRQRELKTTRPRSFEFPRVSRVFSFFSHSRSFSFVIYFLLRHTSPIYHSLCFSMRHACMNVYACVCKRAKCSVLLIQREPAHRILFGPLVLFLLSFCFSLDLWIFKECFA